MKNLKTKIGISLTALACFLMVGCATEKKQEPKREPYVVKVAKLTKEIVPNSYKTSDGKTISFSYRESEKGMPLYLELEISKGSSEYKVFIRDFDLNNLDEQDDVIYGSESYYPPAGVILFDGTTFKFGALSEDLQMEIRKEYSLRIKEAPEILLEADNKYNREIQREKEQEKQGFENNVLNILK
ncbi:MAG: hypothetical protein KKA79_02450 [Nanoarchaeota archaeon]|nr:hypothetical protein [Nanoarchaeota archaeon]MCG2718233.1 hypothetical protein [Nanoarchaeota archaeon]